MCLNCPDPEATTEEPEKEETVDEERKWTPYDACAAVEGFDGEDHDEETLLSAWQYLVNTGLAWTLQGSYGRTASRLIEAGLIQVSA